MRYWEGGKAELTSLGARLNRSDFVCKLAIVSELLKKHVTDRFAPPHAHSLPLNSPLLLLSPRPNVALSSDMVPPFLAYYGVVNDNSSLIQEAYTQCELYRRYLRTSETGLWRHIIWGTSPDDGLWATGTFTGFYRGGDDRADALLAIGNGWAAAGMLRVVATIKNSPYANEYSAQTANLTSWVVEIVEAAFKMQRVRTALLPSCFDLWSSSVKR